MAMLYVSRRRPAKKLVRWLVKETFGAEFASLRHDCNLKSRWHNTQASTVRYHYASITISPCTAGHEQNTSCHVLFSTDSFKWYLLLWKNSITYYRSRELGWIDYEVFISHILWASPTKCCRACLGNKARSYYRKEMKRDIRPGARTLARIS